MKRTPFAKAHEIAARFRKEPRPLLAKASDSKAALYIYEVIGEDWWTGGGVTAKSVRDALDEVKGAKTLDIYINSEGGDVFEAKAIYEQLKRFEGEKVVHVDGIAASAATFIAMAGDRIITAPAATWMVHEAWSIAAGRASDMRAMADVLDLQNESIAGIYAERTKRPVSELRDIMAAETWMDAEEAKRLGFTDEIAREEEKDDDEVDAKASPLIAASLRTEERIRSVSAADLMAARAEMRRLANQSDRASPGRQRTTGQPEARPTPQHPKETKS